MWDNNADLVLDFLQPQKDLLVLADNVFEECAGWDYNGDVLSTVYPHLNTSVSFLGSQDTLNEWENQTLYKAENSHFM